MEAVVLDEREPNRVACPVGEERWHLEVTMLRAVPVRQQHPSGLWTMDRSRVVAPVTQDPDDGGPVWTYRWACGEGELVHTLPAWDFVPCTLGGPNGCRVYLTRQSPPLDYYVNPRHGQACECCGHQGTHRVRRDGKWPPLCREEVAA